MIPTRILIVEDSPTQAEALRALVEQAGYEVTLAPNGEAGLGQFEDGAFDVVISDIVMPGAVDGYELCRRIKSGPRRDTPVVLLTSLSDPLDIIRGLECGADNFFTKSVPRAHLLERLKLLLTTRETRAQARFQVGVKVVFLGREFTVTSEREQILDLLISTFEDAVRQNRELREREEELRDAKEALSRYAGTLEQRLRSVLDSVPDVVYSVSPDLAEWYYLSPACERVFGHPPAEFLADPLLLRRGVHEEDAPSYLANIERVREGGRRTTLEYRYQHPDGAVRWIQETVVPIRASDGAVERLDGIARDVTAERRLAEQLRLAQKMEAVGTLAGGIAHDFNNVLAVVRSTVDLILVKRPLTEQLRDDLRQIEEAVEHAAGLTRQLLAFGRKQVLEPRLVELNALLADTAKMVERIIGEDVRVVLRPTTDATAVTADAGQLQQVIMNLCANARDAMPRGGELAFLTERVLIDDDFCVTHPWAKPGDYVRLTVSDTGVGMDAATQARVFEPFFTTKEMGRGTGLGLAVVYGIVKQHGGLIHVYSEPGRGTAFRIYLPHEAGAPTSPPAASPAEIVGGSEVILLAEDDDALRATTAKLLEGLGYRVIPVADGQEALDWLTRWSGTVHLAMLDVVMPQVGGRQVYDRIRVQAPNLRFLFITGYDPATSHVNRLQSLPVEVLAKPYGLQALAAAVRRALDRPPPKGAAPPA